MNRREFIKSMMGAAAVAVLPFPPIPGKPSGRISAADLDRMVAVLLRNRAPGPYYAIVQEDLWEETAEAYKNMKPGTHRRLITLFPSGGMNER